MIAYLLRRLVEMIVATLVVSVLVVGSGEFGFNILDAEHSDEPAIERAAILAIEFSVLAATVFCLGVVVNAVSYYPLSAVLHTAFRHPRASHRMRLSLIAYAGSYGVLVVALLAAGENSYGAAFWFGPIGGLIAVIVANATRWPNTRAEREDLRKPAFRWKK